MRTNKNGVNKDQKDKVKKDGYNRGQHCVYCLTYHMIFVTHYRKPVINDEMSAAMKEFSNHMAEQFRGKVLSAETDRDHIHLLVSLPPNTNISVFVRSIKTQLSREMRKRFPEQIKSPVRPRTTPSLSANPVWARPLLWRAWPSGSSTAMCRRA